MSGNDRKCDYNSHANRDHFITRKDPTVVYQIIKLIYAMQSS